MKNRYGKIFMLSVWAAACFIISPLSGRAQGNTAAQKQQTPSANNPQIVKTFEQRVKDYVRLREGIEGKMPKLSKDSTPEEIKAHKVELERRVREARAGARQGDIFTPEATQYIRAIIRSFPREEKKEIRETVLEADTKGVPLRVNYAYPETKELVQMPPTLLLQLPQLPKQIRYRYVGRHLVLMDRENDLIIDYMLNALP